MKKTKLEKGITLIALIITIIVLLILAVVTIGAIQKSKIIAHAQNAASEYEQAKENEIDTLASYEQLIDENNPNVKKINYDAIAQILTKNMNEEITYEETIKQLKQELSITDQNVTDITDLFITMILKNVGYYYYFYEIDALYGLDSNTNTFVYIEEEGNEEQYTFGQNVKEIKSELERIFIGRTVSEMQEKYNAGTLEEYVLENSDSITEISYHYVNENNISISSITLTKGESETTISRNDDNYSMFIWPKDGSYYKVEISLGT